MSRRLVNSLENTVTLRIFTYSYFITVNLPIPAVLQFVLQVVQQVLLFCSNCIFILLFKNVNTEKMDTVYHII